MADAYTHSDVSSCAQRSEKFVSVVIPCYNKAPFLGEAIESVECQTHTRFEVIVVDDGSSDESRAVASRYPLVRCLSQRNQGPSAARNAGLHASTGQYIVFLDGDDRLLPTALEDGVRALEAHPECAFASGHVHLIASDGTYLRTPDDPCIEREHYRTLLQYNYIWTPAAVMFKRAVLTAMGGYSPDRRGAEDWELYLRIARHFPVYCHAAVVAEYRLSENQLTGNPRQMLQDSLACLSQQWPYIKGNRQFEEAYRKGRQETRAYYGQPLVEELGQHVRLGQWKPAIADLTALLRYDPCRLLQWLVRTLRRRTT